MIGIESPLATGKRNRLDRANKNKHRTGPKRPNQAEHKTYWTGPDGNYGQKHRTFWFFCAGPDQANCSWSGGRSGAWSGLPGKYHIYLAFNNFLSAFGLEYTKYAGVPLRVYTICGAFKSKNVLNPPQHLTRSLLHFIYHPTKCIDKKQPVIPIFFKFQKDYHYFAWVVL